MAPMERVQVMAFPVQENIISIVYIYHTLKYLRTSFHKNIRKTMALLDSIQVVVILCDVIVITLDYCEYFTLKAVLHSFVYAFKLQLEFVILNDVKAMASNLTGIFGSPGFAQTLSRSDGQLSPAAKPFGKSWWSSGLRCLFRRRFRGIKFRRIKFRRKGRRIRRSLRDVGANGALHTRVDVRAPKVCCGGSLGNTMITPEVG
jgi:hypothetical protein